ncbi:hypothetical protein IEQ34_014433 [Dendrobium chrysotoxum]|uniref:Uncharacterized protein n=1 Tax=Dendrobium chrysotoxum TaxID=161865 RepID=A0AAV7GJ32_DENCH|nr:hypothetical protein IEQ34_014433 [Dendrobium chrysotoxum]
MLHFPPIGRFARVFTLAATLIFLVFGLSYGLLALGFLLLTVPSYSSSVSFFLCRSFCCLYALNRLDNRGFLDGRKSSRSFLEALSGPSSSSEFPNLEATTHRRLPCLWISKTKILALAKPFEFALVGGLKIYLKSQLVGQDRTGRSIDRPVRSVQNQLHQPGRSCSSGRSVEKIVHIVPYDPTIVRDD